MDRHAQVLVTGSAGFLGSALIARLLTSVGPDKISAIDLRDRTSAASPGVRWVKGSLLNRDGVSAVMAEAEPTVVFHLAGAVAGDARTIFESNALATSTLLDAVEHAAPSAHVLVIGSAAEYSPLAGGALAIKEDARSDPETVYGASKLAATSLALSYARQRGLQVTVVRPFNLIGARTPHSLLLGALIQRLRTSMASAGPIHLAVGNTHTVRDFLDVADAAEYLVRLASSPGSGRVVNLCSGEGTAVGDLVREVISRVPSPVILKRDPALIREGESERIVGDPTLLRSLTKYLPQVPIADSVRQAWESFE